MTCTRVIVEGVNLSGKSTAFEGLEKHFTESIAITVHGYFHPAARKVHVTPAQAIAYEKRRLQAFFPLLERVQTEEIIFHRFHLTSIAYLQLFYNSVERFHDIEKRLNELNVGLVLLSPTDAAMEERLRIRAEEGKTGPWDQSLTSLMKKKRLYDDAFEHSTLTRKLLVDNSTLDPQTTQRLIIDWSTKQAT